MKDEYGHDFTESFVKDVIDMLADYLRKNLPCQAKMAEALADEFAEYAWDYELDIAEDWEPGEDLSVSMTDVMIDWLDSTKIPLEITNSECELPQAVKALWLPLNSSPDSGCRNAAYDIKA